MAARLVTIVVLASVLTLLQPLSAHAEGDVSQHIAAAEEALVRRDFWRASDEYRKAAELSDDSSLAKQATRRRHNARNGIFCRVCSARA